MCPLYRVLKLLSVSPIYDSSLLLSCLVTVASLIRLDVWHFWFTGHTSFIHQLQLFVFLSVLLSLLPPWQRRLCFW